MWDAPFSGGKKTINCPDRLTKRKRNENKTTPKQNENETKRNHCGLRWFFDRIGRPEGEGPDGESTFPEVRCKKPFFAQRLLLKTINLPRQARDKHKRTIILPRQARDKHRKVEKKEGVLCRWSLRFSTLIRRSSGCAFKFKNFGRLLFLVFVECFFVARPEPVLAKRTYHVVSHTPRANNDNDNARRSFVRSF
eukprot:COSAG06_NODE_5141_length_3685_cov_11021.338260_4_plen_193_part_01